MVLAAVVVSGSGVNAGSDDGDGDGKAVVTEVVSMDGQRSSWLWQGLAIVIGLER